STRYSTIAPLISRFEPRDRQPLGGHDGHRPPALGQPLAQIGARQADGAELPEAARILVGVVEHAHTEDAPAARARLGDLLVEARPGGGDAVARGVVRDRERLDVRATVEADVLV